MLNNLVGSFHRRGDLASAIRAAELRLQLRAPEQLRDTLRAEARALQRPPQLGRVVPRRDNVPDRLIETAPRGGAVSVASR